ncbi:MAG: hypothetical protein A3F09_01225 [Chlamydiae bacterium RIFCSPHIGHO2_12_FULL_49_11]|nr:MAG: hypothetical protein A3F09_01225 [Chlamydiae bacterium RIFCSPHIGHO2_12_FULL_49_11]
MAILIYPKGYEVSSTNEIFMFKALEEAQKAFAADEVPVGAVLVHEGRIIAAGRNRVREKKNSLHHAENICIMEGTNYFDDFRLTGTVLYTTLEPCIMCFGALILSRVKKIIYGARDLRHGALSVAGFNPLLHPIHKIEVEGGVCEEESRHLLQTFFQQRRLDGRMGNII